MKKYFTLMVFAMISFFTASAKAESEPVLNLSGEGLQEVIADRQTQSGLVSIGALVMVDGKIIAKAEAGERKKKSGIAVTVDDQWHMGSISKSMTATLIGTLVEEGLLDWDMTVAQMLPNMAMDESWNEVTLHHLLTHTSGLPGNFPNKVQYIRPEDLTERHQARLNALADILAKPAKSTPGKKFVYSNIGYTLVGAIAGEVTGSNWEALIQEKLFAPLGLDSAGFGPPKGEGELDQPWGHEALFFMKFPKSPDAKMADNTPIIGPAGTVHMSMADLAIYGNEHLLGDKGQGALLSGETYSELHQPFLDDYASGWVVVEEPWADGRMLWHNGSNTMWYALLMVLPEKNTVLVFVTNDGSIGKADEVFRELAIRIAREIEPASTIP
jgi:CubicO group peptidase (beta-lactamase class C family)